jgi:hypothetical protein
MLIGYVWFSQFLSYQNFDSDKSLRSFGTTKIATIQNEQMWTKIYNKANIYALGSIEVVKILIGQNLASLQTNPECTKLMMSVVETVNFGEQC